MHSAQIVKVPQGSMKPVSHLRAETVADPGFLDKGRGVPGHSNRMPKLSVDRF